MWETLKAIRKFVREYRELSDENRRVFMSETLSFLCYRNPARRDQKQEVEEEMRRQASLREIAEREFVPFSYWEIYFNLPNQIGLTVPATGFYPGQIDFVSASDGAGNIYVSEYATFLYAIEIYVDSVKDLPDWCPTVKCEYGTYRTSPQWAKENANADD